MKKLNTKILNHTVKVRVRFKDNFSNSDSQIFKARDLKMISNTFQTLTAECSSGMHFEVVSDKTRKEEKFGLTHTWLLPTPLLLS